MIPIQNVLDNLIFFLALSLCVLYLQPHRNHRRSLGLILFFCICDRLNLNLRKSLNWVIFFYRCWYSNVKIAFIHPAMSVILTVVKKPNILMQKCNTWLKCISVWAKGQRKMWKNFNFLRKFDKNKSQNKKNSSSSTSFSASTWKFSMLCTICEQQSKNQSNVGWVAQMWKKYYDVAHQLLLTYFDFFPFSTEIQLYWIKHGSNLLVETSPATSQLKREKFCCVWENILQSPIEKK